jgi:hypothetical protein
MPDYFYGIIGWVGTILIIGIYFLGSLNKIEPENRWSALVNLFGAAAVGLNVWYNHAWPALGLQVMWGLVAIVTLIKSFLGTRK